MAPLAVFFDVVGSISSPNLTWQQIEQGEFIWDFGDGTPLERGYMAAHVFQNPGTYTVSLSHLVGGVPVASGSRAITVQSFTGNRLTLNNGQIYDTSVLSGLGSGPVLVTAADPNGVLPTICTKLGNGQCDLSGGDRGVSSGTDWRFVGINLEHIAFYPGANTFFYKSRQRPPPAPPGGGQWPGIGLNADDTFIINSVIEGDSGTSDRYGVIGGAGRQRFAVVNSQFNDITYTVGRLYASKVLYAGNTLVKKQASANPAFRLVDGKYYYFKENYIQTTEGCAICSHRGADQPTGSYPGTEKFLIEKNFLSAWAPGASGFGSDQLVRDLVVRNNLISGVSPAVRVVSPKNSEFFPSPGVNTDNIRIYGNSMLASGAYFDALRVDGTGVAIKNNLFSYTGTPADTSPGGDSPRGITAAGDITNNIVYMPTYTSRCLNAAGQTGAGACTDPRFVSTDPNNANFLKIQPNSPAVDTGTPLLGLFSDYAGELRPQGAGYDIGAFEY